jgi:putative peptidoglycan lipid II flippase
MLTLSLVAQSVATVLFPFLSWRAAEMDAHALGRAVSVGMRMTAMVALPVSALLIALSEPVVRLLFERGQFDAGATHAVAWGLAAYFGVWLTNSLGGTVVTALYALKQIRMVSLVEIAGTVLYMTLALTLPWAFDYLGLALALSANYLFNTGIYSYLLFVYLKIPFDSQVAVFYLKCIPAALASATVARLAYSGMAPLWNHFFMAGTARSVADAGAVASATLTALGVYMVILWIMKAPELAMLWKAMSRRMSISFLRG